MPQGYGLREGALVALNVRAHTHVHAHGGVHIMSAGLEEQTVKPNH